MAAKRQIGVKLDSELLERLDAAAKHRGVSRTTAIEMAVAGWLHGGLHVPQAAPAARAIDSVVEARRRGEVEPHFPSRVKT